MDRIIEILFVSVLLFTGIKDFKSKIIPDVFNYSIIFLGILKIIFLNGNFEKSIIGMGVFPLIFILIYGYGENIFKKELIGFGDIKLFGAAGFYYGYSGMYNLMILYNTIFICTFIFIIFLLLIKKIKREEEIPFAPFICLGILIDRFFI